MCLLPKKLGFDLKGKSGQDLEDLVIAGVFGNNLQNRFRVLFIFGSIKKEDDEGERREVDGMGVQNVGKKEDTRMDPK